MQLLTSQAGRGRSRFCLVWFYPEMHLGIHPEDWKSIGAEPLHVSLSEQMVRIVSIVEAGST